MDFKSLFNNMELPPVGEYEAFIEEAKPTVFVSSKNVGIELKVVLRADIEQPSQGYEIRDWLMYPKGHYKFRMLAKAIDELMQGEWDGLKEFSNALIGKPVRVYIDHKEDKFNVDPVARICRYEKGELIPEDCEMAI